MKRKRRQKPEDVARLCIKDKVDLNQFNVKEVPPKGRGVFASTNFAQDEFLLQYYGKLCSWEEGDELERECSSGYRFFLTFKGQRYCIDATEEPSTGPVLGRLVNHGSKKEVNVKLSVIDVDGTPALCLFACRNIQAGEELLYDYGVKGLPWEQKLKGGQELRGNFPCYKGSRWSGFLDRIQANDVPKKQVGRILFSKSCKIADGSNGTQIYVGLLDKKVPVAVKRIPTESATMDLELETQKNFVLPTLTVAEDDDFKYIASPLCECNLEELIENNYPLDNKSSKTQMCYQLILGLHQLHKMDIIHRDLKPRNVLLDHDGNVLLGDFGISRKLVGTTLLTKAVGTLCWMSAESCSQHPRYKKSSDIQMLGCLIYYIFTNGHIPHESTTPFTNQPEGVMANVKNNKYSLHHLGSTHAYFKPLLQRMLTGDEGLRPSIEECMKYFEASLESGIDDSDASLASNSDESSSSAQPSHADKTLPVFSFVTSCVRNSQKHQTERLADLHGCFFTHDFNSCTTHVIMRADENMVCNRTLKYLQGVASKIWVVSFTWVKSSLDKGILLPERDFEIKGDTDSGLSFGPALSRTAVSPLLHGYSIDVLGKSDVITKDEVLTLATLSGASVPGNSTQTSEKMHVVIVLEEKNQHCSSMTSTLQVNRENGPVVQLDWLLDCICTQTIQPLENYTSQIQLSEPSLPKVKIIEPLALLTQLGWSIPESRKLNYSHPNRSDCSDEADKVQGKNMHSASGKGDNFRERGEEKEVVNTTSGDDEEDPPNEVPEYPLATISDHLKQRSEKGETKDQLCARDSEVACVEDCDDHLETEDHDEDEHETELTTDQPLADSNDPITCQEIFDDDSKDHSETEDLDKDEHETELTTDQPLADSNDPITCQEIFDDDSKDHSETEDLDKDEHETELTTDQPLEDSNDPITCQEIFDDDSEDHSETEDLDKDECKTDSVTADPTFEEISEHSDDNSDESIEHEEEKEAEQKLCVKMSKKKKDGKRVLDKYHVCLYCETKQTHIARHLSLIHPNEKEVAQVLAHNIGSKERRSLFKLLVNKGDRLHNFTVLEECKGTLIPRRQPPKKKSADDYLFCDACSGLYLRHELWRHQKFCSFMKHEEEAPQTSRVQNVARNLLPVPKDVTDSFWKIVCDMKQDHISSTVRKEGLILKFGEQLFKKHGKVVCQQNNNVVYDASNSDYIRQKMRELGRLSIAGQNFGLSCIEDFVMPKNFQKVIKAVQQVAGFDCNNMTYKTPSLVLKCGHSLQAISDIVLCQASMANNEEKVKQMEQFQKIYKRLWNPELSSVALTNIRESRWNKTVILPTAKDIQILNNYLHTQILSDECALKKERTLANWMSLVEKTLAYVIVFNRRRVGEVSKLLLKTYETKLKEKTTINEDVVASLTSAEVKLCAYFTRIEIRGKRGRQVPLLLSPLMVRVMKVLTDARKPLSIENPYFFANPNSPRRPYIRGSDCVRKCAGDCGASVPLSLRSTLLRKHLGTTCQILNLTSTELEGLARFMGHNIHVHESFYRLQEGTIQAAKISKILLAMERGQISLFKGKTLDEIDPSPDDADQEESDDEEDDGEDDPDHDDNQDEESRDHNSGKEDPSDLQVKDVATDDDEDDDGDDEDWHDDDMQSSVLSKRKNIVKIPWTPEETAAVQKHFMSHIRKNLAVKKNEAVNCIKKEPTLRSRNWKAVKYKVKNMAVKYQKCQFSTNSK